MEPLVAGVDGRMEAQWVTVVIVGLGLVLTLILQAILATSALAKARKEIDRDAEIRQREVLDELRRESRIVGETIAAIRQDLANHRLYSAETYQRRDSFHQQMSSFNAAMNARFDKIEEATEARFARIDQKLDRIFQRLALGESAIKS